MGIEPYELEEIPPQGHVKFVYTGPVAPHWEIHRAFGTSVRSTSSASARWRASQLLPVYDPQFRRNRRARLRARRGAGAPDSRVGSRRRARGLSARH